MTTTTGKSFHTAIVFCLVLASLWYIWTLAMPSSPIDALPPWQSIVSQKKAELASKIPDEWRLSEQVVGDARKRRSIAGDFLDNLLDSSSRHITSLEPTDIVQLIASGNLTSVDVVTAFCKRAAYIHQTVGQPAGSPPTHHSES